MMFRPPPGRRIPFPSPSPIDENSNQNRQNGLLLTLKEASAVASASASSSSASSSYSLPVVDRDGVIVGVLPDEAQKQLLSRLPQLPDPDHLNPKEFFSREASPPFPKSGEVIKAEFPPKEDQQPSPSPYFLSQQKDLEGGNLQVLRATPQGPLTQPHSTFSLTFSQPMVPVSSLDEVEARELPCSISPQPPQGVFKWLGTKNLVFESKTPFPRSTQYTVRVPRGTRSSTGNLTKEDFTFSFSTQTTKVESSYPSSWGNFPLRELPFVWVRFNQRVEPTQISKVLRAKSSNGKALGVEVINQKQLLEELTDITPKLRPSLKDFGERWKDHLEHKKAEGAEGQEVTIRLVGEIKSGDTITVEIGPHIPSAEGPLTSTDIPALKFTNYPPLSIIRDIQRTIRPNQPLFITFNNQLDISSFDANKAIQVTPPIVDMKIKARGSGITIFGRTTSRTKYTVEVANNFLDIYGQSLGSPEKLDFEISRAAQTFFCFQTGIKILDPTKEATLDFATLNVKEFNVDIYQVDPSSFVDKLTWSAPEDILSKFKKTNLKVKVEGYQEDKLCEVTIKLKPYLQHPQENLGQLFFTAEVPKSQVDKNHHLPTHHGWLQITRIGVHRISLANQSAVWCSSLIDGSPIKGAKITLDQGSGTTDEHGLALFPKSNTTKVIAQVGNDFSFAQHMVAFGDLLNKSPLAHIFSDRGLYKPKETVNLRGYLRELKNDGPTYRVELTSVKVLTYKVRDSHGTEFAQGSTAVSPTGGFNVQIILPDNINLGDCSVIFTAEKQTFHHSFKVQEFRTPEFEVQSSVEPLPYIAGESAIVVTKAEYYSGGGLSGSEVEVVATQSNSSYSPPGWKGFKFQEDRPIYWWWWPFPQENPAPSATHQGTTDESGEYHVAVHFEETERKVKRPVTVNVESRVQDINRQTLSSSTSFIVHPSSLYVGINFDKPYLKPTQSTNLQVIVTDVNGKPAPGHSVTVKIESIETDEDGQRKEVLVKETKLVSQQDPVSHPFSFEKGGYFKFSCEIQDEKGRKNQTSSFLTVFGRRFGSSSQTQTPMIIPNKEEYEVGDVAKLTVQAPFQNVHGFYFVVCNEVEQHGPLKFSEGSTSEISIPIKPYHTHNAHVFVQIIGTSENRPACGSGEIRLKVPAKQKEIKVEVLPHPQYVKPASKVEVEVEVKDFEGKKVPNAEVCLVGVDEAVLSLIDYRIPNPFSTFHPDHTTQIAVRFAHDMLAYVDFSTVQIDEFVERFPEMMPMMARSAGAPMMMMKKGAIPAPMALMAAPMAPSPNAAPAIQVRTNFNPLAIFAPSVFTDPNGKAKLTFTLPDNLTRYRLTAICSHGTERFGLGESFLVAQLPVSIRPSLPRFLNFGDDSLFSCVLANQTQSQVTVHVTSKRTSHLESTGNQGFSVVLPAHKRAEIRFPIHAERVGSAKFMVGAAVVEGGEFSDAVEKSIPIYTPATGEAFATYGDFDNDGFIKQPIQPPTNVYPQFGELRVSTSSTALQALTDGFLYLYNYPFECSEQLASKIIPILALKDVLKAFNVPDLPSDSQVSEFIESNLKRIYKSQRLDGGFGFWADSNRSSSYVTVHVGHCIARSRAAGYKVDVNVCERLIEALMHVETLDQFHSEKKYYWPVRAYAYFVLSLFENNKATNLATQLIQEASVDQLDTESLSFLAQVFFWEASKQSKNTPPTLHEWTKGHFGANTNEGHLQQILKKLNNHVHETAETANFVTSFGNDYLNKMVFLHSNTRTDAIILDMLLHLCPKDPLLPKVVKGLLASRKKGKWNNTQENAWVLIALNKYFRTFEAVTPDFLYSIWLGDQFVNQRSFKGRTAETVQVDIPLHVLLSDTNQKNLLISRTGKGRLYYRVGLSYAPKEGLKARDYGFGITRKYEGVTDPSHVTFDPQTRTYTVKAGELVRVRVRVITNSVRYHVALVDRIPAGFEILNPDLKSTPSFPSEPTKRMWWEGPWYEHQNLRDERAEAFAAYLNCGVHNYSFVCRATSLGKYFVPPSHMEEMYSPELFGRSDADLVIIK